MTMTCFNFLVLQDPMSIPVKKRNKEVVKFEFQFHVYHKKI